MEGEKIKEKMAKGADMRHIVDQTKERKRLDILDELKDLGGIHLCPGGPGVPSERGSH